MKKRSLFLLLTALLILCLPALAEEDPWAFDAEKARLTAYRGDAESVVIPASIGGVPVRSLDQHLMSSMPSVTALTIPETVQTIGSGAFSNLEELTTLTLCEGLQVIDDNAFLNVPKLTQVTLPATLRYLGASTFTNTSALTSVTFLGECPIVNGGFRDMTGGTIYVPDDQYDAYVAAFRGAGFWDDQLAQIRPSGQNAVKRAPCFDAADYTFDPATGTLSAYTGTSAVVDIPAQIDGADVRCIGAKTFLYHDDVLVVTLPEGVTRIEDWALRTTRLLAAGLPASLEYVGDHALENYLGSAAIGPNVTYIGDSAFSYSKLSGARPSRGPDACGRECLLALQPHQGSHLPRHDRIYRRGGLQGLLFQLYRL